MRWMILTLVAMVAGSVLAGSDSDIQRQIDVERRKVQAQVAQTDEYKAIALRVAEIDRKLDQDGLSDKERPSLAQEKQALTARYAEPA